MKEIPILFSTDMVRAILDGRKTMTRRTKGLEEINDDPNDWQFEWYDYALPLGWCFTQKSTVTKKTLEEKSFYQARLKCPYGQPGDILWVRESFSDNGCGYFRYKTDFKDGLGAFDNGLIHPKFQGKWKPGIHMPKLAARIYLQVEAVRVERLKDISEADAKAEGVEIGYAQQGQNKPDLITYKNYLQDRHVFIFPKASFITLWRSINGPDSWAANPWVWVISFKVLSTTGRPEFLPALVSNP